MPLINRLTDPNSAGGVVSATKQSFFRVNRQPVASDGDPVSPHAPCPIPAIHCSAVTASGFPFYRVVRIPINENTNPDTCGHPRASSVTFFNIEKA